MHVPARPRSPDTLSHVMQEHTRVRLCRDFPASGLLAGATGTVVHVYQKGAGYEVEFTQDHDTPVLETLLRSDLESITVYNR